VTLGRDAVDLSLYLITDTRLCAHKGVLETVREAVDAGVTLVQLRDPDASDADFVALGRALAAALTGTGVPLIVNDRVHLVAAIGADGAHIGQGDISVADARRILPSNAFLGLSVQHPKHLVAARSGQFADIDYLGIGPVWAQTTKPDAVAPIGLDGLRALVQSSPWPCVAIGGIDADKAQTVRASGAAGVAVVSAICGQPDIGAATRALRAAWMVHP
jgi:thiamine-phosphate pyrophosphorylase